MFLDELTMFIKRFEELELENKLLQKEIKRLHKSDKSDQAKIKKKEKKYSKTKETPSLF